MTSDLRSADLLYRVMPAAPTEEPEISSWPTHAESDGVDSVDTDQSTYSSAVVHLCVTCIIMRKHED